MSLCDVIVQSREVHLVTDAACYDQDGRIVSLVSKVTALPRAKAAVGSIGLTGLIHQHPRFCDARSLTEVLSIGSDVVAEQAQRNRAAEGHGWSAGEANICLVVIGWSPERRAFEAWGISNTAGQSPFPADYEPFTPLELPSFLVSPAVDFEAALSCQVRTLRDVQGLEPLTAAKRLADAQRDVRVELAGRPHQVVGGYAELTTVSAKGVSVRLVRDWPDQTGEEIGIHAAL